MPRFNRKQKRFALPKDAVYFKQNSETNTPIRLFDFFEDWLRGTTIDEIAATLNVTMREMDVILRQLVLESLAHTKKNEKEKEAKASTRRPSSVE